MLSFSWGGLYCPIYYFMAKLKHHISNVDHFGCNLCRHCVLNRCSLPSERASICPRENLCMCVPTTRTGSQATTETRRQINLLLQCPKDYLRTIARVAYTNGYTTNSKAFYTMPVLLCLHRHNLFVQDQGLLNNRAILARSCYTSSVLVSLPPYRLFGNTIFDQRAHINYIGFQRISLHTISHAVSANTVEIGEYNL